MQYVRSISGSVSKTWNSINPATLSGAIDVIVVEREDGTLACSPFHVRFGKFQLLRPSEKKVVFKVNDVARNFPMKVGEGGEAFFVFETSENIPHDLQTSPVISPTTSPQSTATGATPASPLLEPEPFELEKGNQLPRENTGEDFGSFLDRPKSADGMIDVHDDGLLSSLRRPNSGDWSSPATPSHIHNANDLLSVPPSFDRSASQPPENIYEDSQAGASDDHPHGEVFDRAVNLSRKLSSSNIPTTVSNNGDLKLDMAAFKTSEEHALKAEVIARRILSEEMEGNYDIGSLIGADEKGNIWIYGSEAAKEAADRKAGLRSLNPAAMRSTDAVSDPGYHSDDAQSESGDEVEKHRKMDQDSALGASTPGSPVSIQQKAQSLPNRNYAKTLRLTDEQLRSLDLKSGANSMSFTVNKSTCPAVIYYWRYDVPIVISDIDGTITKSDALGHVFNYIGRDWTHIGVAKLYTDIVANGYHILYLTSRSVGQADTTRGYLNGVVQDSNRLPKGPVIMSPDRTMAALRREVYLRKPEVFKMACLRDVMNLFTTDTPVFSGSTDSRPNATVHQKTPFYAGFGNRLTDALSYRSVAIPPTRIFTINSNAEVSLYLLTLNSYRTSYLSIWELVDHYFPPVGLLVKDGGEDYTDFNYWRDKPREVIDFSDSESEDEDEQDEQDADYDDDRPFILDDESDMEASFMSHNTDEEPMRESILDTVEEDTEYDRRPEVIIEEDEDEEESFLVAESRQLQALDLAAKEIQDAPPIPLERAVTAPDKNPKSPGSNSMSSSFEDGDARRKRTKKLIDDGETDERLR